MDILITGRPSYLCNEALRDLASVHNVVCVDESLKQGQFDSNITTFRLSAKDPDFERVIRSYNFSVVLFFSDSLYQEKITHAEIDELEHCLNLCAYNNIKRFAYFHPNIDESGKRKKRCVLQETCLKLCDYYSRHMPISLVTVKLPNIYGRDEFVSIVGKAVSSVQNGQKVVLKGSQKQCCAFLAAEDLNILLKRMCEDWPGGDVHLQIPPADVITLEKLANELKAHYPKLRVTYTPTEVQECVEFNPILIKERYQWSPIRHLAQELPALVKQRRDGGETKARQSLGDRFYSFAESHPNILRGIELILGFLLMELLIRSTDTTAQFRYIDFRLLFVAAMGIVHGIETGLVAAFLAAGSLLYAMASAHSAWYAVAHDIDAWLPLMFLFLIGGITGHTKNRFVVKNKALMDEMEKLEEKYILLSEFYVNALNRKDQFKKQIGSYKYSFGRLFDITRELDSTLVEEVYAEAVNALENILENESISIYTIAEDSSHVRLIACSKAIREIAGKKVNLTEYPHLMANLSETEVWVNRARLENYPEYAYPIFFEDKLVALIIISSADYTQMSLYYENLVKIGCGMVKIALLRAMEFTRHTESEMYVDGTSVLNAKYFSRFLDAKEKMTQRGIAEYSLIKLDIPREKLAEISAQISPLIYATDVLGIGRDGNVYLCLSQINQQNAQRALLRLQKLGIPLNVSLSEGNI